MSPSPELFRALAVVSEGASPSHQRVAASLGVTADPAAYADLFCFQLPPYASIHLGPEGMLGGEAAERVAGFWRALGLVPPAEPDHLAALLGLYASLVEAEAGEGDPARRLLWGEARRALLWEHLLVWVPGYARAAARVAGPGYRPWAEVLLTALVAEATAGPYGDRPLPLHLREAPPALAGVFEEDGRGDEYLGHLLAPARSGMVITRQDLAGAARRLGLGLRMGERRFALSALVAQDPVAVIGWLADVARSWAEEHGRLVGALGPVALYWRRRAKEAETDLRRRRREAKRAAAMPRDATSRRSACDPVIA
ncbi:MAG TPA: molecular chaperone TorD family protein [Acidimicrobiia bacterium]|jgi:TorA maturation chaperone TorD